MEAWSSRQGPESVVIPVGLTGMTTDSVAYSVAYLGGGALARAPLWPDQRNFGTESVIFAFNLAPKPSKFMYISKNRSVSGGLRPPYLLSGLCPWTPLGPSPRPPGWAPPLWPILNTPLGLLCFINVNTYKVRQDPLDTIAPGTVVLSR